MRAFLAIATFPPLVFLLCIASGKVDFDLLKAGLM